MKLIFCPYCQDIVKLRRGTGRYCDCGMVHGRYLDDGWHAEISSDAIAIGISNHSFITGIRGDRKAAHTFDAWIFSRGGKDSERIKWLEPTPI